MNAPNLITNLKSTEELAYLVSKGLAQVIRFSTSQQLMQSCLKLLNVNNSFEAEKIMCKQLIEWKTKEPNDLEVSKHGEALKEHKLNELAAMVIKDLDDWD